MPNRRSQSFEVERPPGVEARSILPGGVGGENLLREELREEDECSCPPSDTDKGEPKAAVPLRYTVIDVPPPLTCIVLGFQHYLTMLGSTVVIPALLVPKMGGTDKDHARVVQTIFFVSGINTLIQTSIGDRLPIVQGGSFSFLLPAFSIIANIQASMTFASEHDRFLYTMRELQGSIIGSSLVVMAIGYSGAMGALLRFISPVTVAPTVCMVGLSLYAVGFKGMATCLEQGFLSMVAVIMFSQVLRKVEIPIPRRLAGGGWALGRSTGAAAALAGDSGPLRVRIFELFPVLWSIILAWSVAGIATAAGAYDHASAGRQLACRTDDTKALEDAPWVYVPYPLQWGTPIFNFASIITMLSGALAAMIESTGDYYACARMSGAPTPPPYIISRGVGAEGLGCCMSGLFGTGNGTTSYAENIGAIGLTGVGSRRVVQVGATIMLGLGIMGKFGALFASIPGAIISGLFCVMFGLITGVGLSNLQFTDQNSSRNMLIVGFAIYMALSVPSYFDQYRAEHNGTPPIQSGSTGFNDITNTLASTPMVIALVVALVLDNVIAGTPTERGLTHWAMLATGSRRAGGSADDESSCSDDDYEDPSLAARMDPKIKAVYDLPFGLQTVNERYILPYRFALYRAIRRCNRSLRRCCNRMAPWRGAAGARRRSPSGGALSSSGLPPASGSGSSSPHNGYSHHHSMRAQHDPQGPLLMSDHSAAVLSAGMPGRSAYSAVLPPAHQYHHHHHPQHHPSLQHCSTMPASTAAAAALVGAGAPVMAAAAFHADGLGAGSGAGAGGGGDGVTGVLLP